MSDAKLLYTREEAAVVLAMSPRRVDELRRLGKLIARQDGRAYRYHIDDLRVFAGDLPTSEPV